MRFANGVQAIGAWLTILGGIVVFGSVLSRGIAKLFGAKSEDLHDPYMIRYDVSGISRGVHWWRPGLIVIGTGLAILGLGGLVELIS